MKAWPAIPFGDFLKPNRRPYTLGPTEDADLVGMRLYGGGPFHRERKLAMRIRKKSHFVIREGDIIYNKLFAWKGTFGVVPSALDGMFVSDKFPTYELDEGTIDRGYLGWYFRHPLLWEQAKVLSTGTAALSKLTLNPPRFLRLTIPAPPLDEQRRIALEIEGLAAKVGEARQLRGASERNTGSILGSYLNRLSSMVTPSSLLTDVMSGKPRNGWSPRCDNAEGGTPVLSLSAVTGFRYDSGSIKRTSLSTDPDAHYWLSKGDLLVTRSNTPELVGHAAIYNGDPYPCIYSDLMMRVPIDHEKADVRFVWYWLQSPPVRDYMWQNSKGTSPTMKKISQGTVMEVPFPGQLTVKQQKEWTEKLDRILNGTRRLEETQSRGTKNLGAILPSILEKAFRGEL